MLDHTAAQVLLAIESGDSIRCVAQHLHTPYETVRQAVNRLEDAGYVTYDEGLSVVDEHVRDAARELVAASAGVSPPSIEEAYVIPQFGEWPFAFTRVDAVYVWTPRRLPSQPRSRRLPDIHRCSRAGHRRLGDVLRTLRATNRLRAPAQRRDRWSPADRSRATPLTRHRAR